MIGRLLARVRDLPGIVEYLLTAEERQDAFEQRIRRANIEAELARQREAAAIRDRDAAIARADRAQLHADGCRAVVFALIEPGRVEQCTKVRLRDAVEAREFADRMAADTGIDPASIEVYRCRFCPRHPVSLDAFWHMSHADPAKRGQFRKVEPARSTELTQRATPADVARMRRVAQ